MIYEITRYSPITDEHTIKENNGATLFCVDLFIDGSCDFGIDFSEMNKDEILKAKGSLVGKKIIIGEMMPLVYFAKNVTLQSL